MSSSDFPAQAWYQSPYGEDSTLSSSASNGVYHDGVWNPFDSCFGSYNPTDLVSGNQYSSSSKETSPVHPPFDPNTNSQQWRKSFVNLSAINENTLDSYDEVLLDCVKTPKPKDTSPPPLPGRSMKTQRRSSRTSREVNLISPRLRSTATSQRRHSTCSSTSNGSGTRTNHNAVEKEYRNRLNGQFETLLQALPKDCIDDLSDGVMSRQDKKVSKAEVLILAKKRIEELERENLRLEKEYRGLEGVVGELRERWRGVGGIMLP